MNRRQYQLELVGVAALLAGCGGSSTETAGINSESNLGLSTAAFDDGGSIPARYTCEGRDVNPKLTVSGVPGDAETLALILDDPDAGESPYVHWLLWNVPAFVETIPQDVAPEKRPPFSSAARQGRNSSGDIGYMGPCPPTSDGPHTYRFQLSAVDTTLDVPAGANREDLEAGLDGNVLDSVTLTGTYERS